MLKLSEKRITWAGGQTWHKNSNHFCKGVSHLKYEGFFHLGFPQLRQNMFFLKIPNYKVKEKKNMKKDNYHLYINNKLNDVFV